MAPPYDIQERTFEFSIQVVLFCRQAMRGDPALALLARQLLKAATSVGANMEEADGGQTKPDFITKVSIAKKEAKEAVYWLRLIAATEARLRERVWPMLDEAKQIASIVSAIQLKAETNRKRTVTVMTLLILGGCYWLSMF
jgi:four helix bundle protein